MPKKTAEKETVKKDKQINNQIKRKRKHFEFENEASQVGLKILTRPSTDFPVAYGDKKSIEEIMADNYDEINEPFKLQAQQVFVATSSESDELSANMDNYTSVTNNKMLLHTADVAVEDKPESLIISPIESNEEAQTQIKFKKPSERDKLLAKTRVQRKKLSKEVEASMDVEVNLLQQRFNKIELEKAKEKKLYSQKQEERQKHEEDKRNKRNEINQEIQSAFDRGISPYKAFKESNSGLSLSAFYKKKKIYNEDNSLANRREGSGRNPKLNEKLIGLILGVLFKDRKETLASLAKILNDNFGVKVSEKTINRVLHAHDIEWTKPILKPKFDERIQKSRIEFCKYYLYIVDNARYVYTDESHFYTKNPYSERWVFPGEEFHEEQRKSGNQRISVYGAISRKAKFPLVFFTGNMDSKKYIK